MKRRFLLGTAAALALAVTYAAPAAADPDTALAELQNVSRRRKQEMETSIVYAQESLIRGLLPVLDDIERALEASKDRGDAFRAGLAMIQDRLWRTLEKEGLEAIRPSGGPFDPNLHDAVAQRPAADQSPDTVLEVMLPGYRLRGRVLRHAQVIVAGAPQAKGAAEEQP